MIGMTNSNHPAQIAAEAVKTRSEFVKNAVARREKEAAQAAAQTAGSPEASVAPASRPANKATKAEWIAYAERSTGEALDPESWTKAQLIENFGDN